MKKNKYEDLEYASKLISMIEAKSKSLNDSILKFNHTLSNFDPLKSSMEIAGSARLVKYEAQELCNLMHDFDSIISIKENYEFRAAEAKKTLEVYNKLLLKK